MSRYLVRPFVRYLLLLEMARGMDRAAGRTRLVDLGAGGGGGAGSAAGD